MQSGENPALINKATTPEITTIPIGALTAPHILRVEYEGKIYHYGVFVSRNDALFYGLTNLYDSAKYEAIKIVVIP